MNHILNPVELLFISVLLVFSLIVNLIFCESGETVRIQFEMLNDVIGQGNWYLFPSEMQHMFIIAMANAQHQILIRGYGNSLCTRETFRKVIDIDRKNRKIEAKNVFYVTSGSLHLFHSF